MINDLQQLRELTANRQVNFIRIKEHGNLLNCEVFSANGYIGKCVLKNKTVIDKFKDHTVINKLKGEDLEVILKDIARLHLKMKSGWIDET